jgi:hypothetical protein
LDGGQTHEQFVDCEFCHFISICRYSFLNVHSFSMCIIIFFCFSGRYYEAAKNNIGSPSPKISAPSKDRSNAPTVKRMNEMSSERLKMSVSFKAKDPPGDNVILLEDDLLSYVPDSVSPSPRYQFPKVASVKVLTSSVFFCFFHSLYVCCVPTSLCVILMSNCSYLIFLHKLFPVIYVFYVFFNIFQRFCYFFFLLFSSTRLLLFFNFFL